MKKKRIQQNSSPASLVAVAADTQPSSPTRLGMKRKKNKQKRMHQDLSPRSVVAMTLRTLIRPHRLGSG